MDIRPLVVAALLLVALVAALVAVPISLVKQVLNPVQRTADDDETI
jgi:hypothetical protein